MRKLHIKAFIAVCAVLFVNCAYLNTFYNAKIAFRNAYREQTRYLRTRSDTAAAMPSSITSNYNRAIAKSAKVLEVYPKDKKWHDDAIFLMGRASYYNGELGPAIRRFRRLQREFPKSPFIPESYLYLGRAYLENDNLAKAEETFRILLERYPKLNANEEVTLLMAELAIKREGKSQAIELLEKTLASVKVDEKRIELLLRIADLYLELGQYDNAIVTLNRAPRKRKLPNLLYRLDFAYLNCYSAKEMYNKALGLANIMLRNRQYLLHYTDVKLQKGIVLKKMGRIDDAIDVFRGITELTDVKKELQGRAWFELAMIYQHDKGDWDMAKECFEKALPLLPEGEMRAIAQERSNAISSVENYRKILEDGLADTADTNADTTDADTFTRYKLGEVFWLNLKEPDSALVHFEQISDDSSASDSLRTKAFYAQAWILLHMTGDTVRAESLFTSIIENNPATLFAQRAQRELDIPVTVKTRQDSAHEEFLSAEELYFKKAKPVAACNAYIKVAKKYSDQDIAPQSIYAAAWLCDNILNKNVTARKLYRMLCDSFPQSDLCMREAKPRLRIVQDTLEAMKKRGSASRTSRNVNDDDLDEQEGALGAKTRQNEQILAPVAEQPSHQEQAKEPEIERKVPRDPDDMAKEEERKRPPGPHPGSGTRMLPR